MNPSWIRRGCFVAREARAQKKRGGERGKKEWEEGRG